MFSRILIKLIDQSIVPALLLVTVRVVSVIIFSRIFDVKYFLGTGGFTYFNRADYILMNSYSTFWMIAAIAVGLLYILLKALIFHETHISPHLTTRLFAMRMETLIQTSYDLYSQGTIWLSYLYFLTLSSGILVFTGLIYAWVFWVSFALAIFSTAILIFDIDNEISSNKVAEIEEEEVILSLRGLDE